jgi:hypothetical protein
MLKDRAPSSDLGPLESDANSSEENENLAIATAAAAHRIRTSLFDGEPSGGGRGAGCPSVQTSVG